jgi:DNA-binding transcriptional regulator YdaS (Cro superfamily)
MKKSEAIDLLGGTNSAAAAEIGISPSAVGQWPDELPRTISDRVLAALWRRSQGIPPPTRAKKDDETEAA